MDPNEPLQFSGAALPSVTPLGYHSIYRCECRASVPELLVIGESLGPEGWQLSPALGFIRQRRGSWEKDEPRLPSHGGMQEGGWGRCHCPSDAAWGKQRPDRGLLAVCREGQGLGTLSQAAEP